MGIYAIGIRYPPVIEFIAGFSRFNGSERGRTTLGCQSGYKRLQKEAPF